MNILYISDSYLDLSVFMSQVHTLCNYHSEQNNIKLIALCNHRDITLDKPIDAKYELIKIYRYPKMFIPFVNKFRALTVSNKIRKELEWANVIHCRGHVGSFFAVNLLHKFNLEKKVIGDIRGAIVDERESKKSMLENFYKLQAEILEKAVFEHVNYFFFVSYNMMVYYKEKYNFKQKSEIFPTIVNESHFYKCEVYRKNYRVKLNIKDRKVYIYIGGTDHWQNVNQILLKFNEINIKEPDKYFFIILTKNTDFVRNFCNEKGIILTNFYIASVAYRDVGKYLNASDYGVIIRNKSIVNHVASPTKINEYLACDLKIIDNLGQIGVGNIFLNQKYRSTKDIISCQNKFFLSIR